MSVNCCRAADVLLAGAVMNRVFQPHEVHIPYILQVSTSFTGLAHKYCLHPIYISHPIYITG